MTTSASLTIFLFVVGVLLSAMGFMVVLLLRQILNRLDTNTKHIVRLARAGWGIAIRQTDVEQHLKERDDYKPVRIKDSDPPVL